MYTTSGARNAQHQWIPSITSVGTPSYINIQAFRTFSGDTLSLLSCAALGCSSFLRVPRDRILFSLASCVISRSENITPAGQPYILATLPPFAANILQLLQSKSAEIYSSIKELNALVKAKVITTEAGDDIEKSSELGPMRTITVRIANSNKLCSNYMPNISCGRKSAYEQAPKPKSPIRGLCQIEKGCVNFAYYKLEFPQHPTYSCRIV
jgi:hypothetical protein